MTNSEIFCKVDHTLLKMTSTWEEIKTLCDEAVRFKTASVCIPACYVKPVSYEYIGLNICTVVGFPLGYCITAAKVIEAEYAVLSGANEIDMVINVCDVKNNNFNYVLEEIKLLRDACQGKILKVIIETCCLTQEEKIKMCGIVGQAGADYIKTSTGFGTSGAALADIELFKKHIGSDVKIKASGGIKTREELEAFISAGASRIGTSSAVKLLCGASS